MLELVAYPVLGLRWVDAAGVSDLVGKKSPRSQVEPAFVDGETFGLASLAMGAVADDFGQADRLSGQRLSRAGTRGHYLVFPR